MHTLIRETPAGTSQLIDVLPSGEDAGACEFATGLEREASLPHVSASGLTVQEDGAPLLIDSLVPNAIDAVAAHGTVSKNDQGQLVYRTEMNFQGHDRLARIIRNPTRKRGNTREFLAYASGYDCAVF